MHNVSANKQKLQIIQQCMGLLRSIVDSNDQGLSAVIKELEKQAQDIFKSNPEFAEKLRDFFSCPMQNAPILLAETELTFFVLPPVQLCALSPH